MKDKNLPEKRTDNQITLAPRLVPGVLIVGGLVGIIFTSLDLIFGLTMVCGISIFFIRALLNKSLEATSGLHTKDPMLDKLKQQEHQVAQTKYLTKVSSLGEAAHAQAKELTERYILISNTLNKKFNPGELAYSRYHEAVFATIESLTDNFQLIIPTLASIDVSTGPADDQNLLVNQLLESNAATLRLLAELSHSLNQINAGGSLDTSLEHSMEELKRLTEQAKKYSR